MKKFMTSILSLALIFTLTGCGASKPSTASSGSSSGDSKELVVVDWGGNYTDVSKKSRYEPFEKKYNVKIKIVSPTDYGKLKAMVQSKNVEWDVINVDTDFAIRGGKQGLLEKLDFNTIDVKDVDKQWICDYGVGSEIYDIAISYNTNTFKDSHPTTWKEIWDVNKFPGSRSFQKYPEGTLEAALLADGVEPDKLYPLDIDRAFKSLDKIKSNVKTWWTSGAQPPQQLATGDISSAAAWSGRILAAKKQGSPIDVEYNQALVFGDSWVIPKGAPHKDLAMKFINFCTTPEVQAEFSKLVEYSPTNTKALDLLSEDVKKNLGQTSDAKSKKIPADESWWADNFDTVNERLEKWLLK